MMIDPTPEQIANIEKALDAAKALEGVKIELVGAWIWVSGDTKAVKEQLKSANFKWAHKKSMWYFPGVKSSGRGKHDLNYLRGKYGSTVVKE